MRQCGNTTSGRAKPIKVPLENIPPQRTLTKVTKRKKREKCSRKARRYGVRHKQTARKREYPRRRRRKKKQQSARRVRRPRSTSSSSFESDSSCSCKRICRRPQRSKQDETSEPSHSNSGSFQDSVPATKNLSPDASQNILAFEQWDLNMPQAIHETLEAPGFEVPGIPPPGAKQQEKPQGSNHSHPQFACMEPA